MKIFEAAFGQLNDTTGKKSFPRYVEDLFVGKNIHLNMTKGSI